MRRVAVVGGGTMGAGIAFVAARAGGAVMVAEPDGDRAADARRIIARAGADAVARGKLDEDGERALSDRIAWVRSAHDLPDDLDLIVESVPELIDVKLEVLAAATARRPRLLATNTSALSIDRLAGAVAEPERFLGMHFFNPVWSLKLIELVRGAATGEAALDEARAIAGWIGKKTLTVRDVPGFATSRLDLIASLEAMRMLEGGVASAEDIDRAAVLAYRHPVGPLRLSDIVGLDVRLDIARALTAAHGDRFAPPRLLEEMVAAGQLGVKTGRGFFAWPQEGAA